MINYSPLSTTCTLTVGGNATFAGDVSLTDNKKLTFGASPDFEIYHNSTTNVNHISSLLSRQLSISADSTIFSGDLYIAEASNKGQLFFGTASTAYEIKGGGNYGYLSLNAPILRFDIGGTEIMRINSAGNVGIATTSPGYKLDVNDTARVRGELRIGANINAYQGDASIWVPNVGQAFTVKANTGNVGIGTTSPNQLLELKKTSGTVTARLHADHESTPRTGIELMRGTSDTWGGDAYTDWKIGSGSSSDADLAITSKDTTSGENERVTIEYNTGNVGIGITSPDGVLHIKKDNATATFEIQGGKNSHTVAGAVNGEINFGANDASTTGGIGASIKNISQVSNGAHNGLAFYTGLQSRTPYLQQMLYFTAQGGLSFGTTNAAYGTSGQVLKSNADAPPSWVNASTVIGGPYLPLSAGSTKKLTDTLYIQGTNNTGSESVLLRGVSSSGGDFLGSIRTANTGSYDQEMRFYTSNQNGTTNENLVLTLDASQDATFAGNIVMGDNDITGIDQLIFSSGTYLQDISSNYVNLRYASATAGGLLVSNGNGTQGYLYASGGATSEFGLLTGAGQWAVRTIENGLVELRHNNAVKFQTTTGGVTITGGMSVGAINTTGTLDISATYPRINLNDTNSEDDWSIINDDGSFTIYNVDDNVHALKINTSNNTTFAGNITVTGTSSTINTGNNGTIVTNDGVSGGYTRITKTSSSAQLGLFRASSGGFYIGGDSSKFRVYNSSFSEKFSVDTAGNATFTGDVIMGGNNITGVGTIKANGDLVLNTSTGEHAVYGAANAQTMIYHNGVKKFETTSVGVEIAGAIAFNGGLNSTGNLIMTTASSGANIELYTNGQAYYDGVSHSFRDSDASPTYFSITSSQANSFVKLSMASLKIIDLATPTLSTDAANKAYVDAQIATIPSGLNFQGNWNASTNSPTLASGTGTPGFYYNVSVAGTTNLDGETDWQVGDWAVFVENGTNDFWEKIDNTSALTGVGVSGRVTFWNGTNTLSSDGDFTYNSTTNVLTIGGHDSAGWNDAYNNTITGFSDSGSSTITLTLTQRDGGTLTTSFSNPQGTVTGNGATNRIAYWANGTMLQSNAGFTFDGTNFVAPGAGTFGGNVGASGTIFASNNSPAYSFSSDTNTGIARTGTHQMGFLNNNSTSLTLAADLSATFAGDLQAPGVYIGATNTSFDLYNNGTSYLNGAVTVDSTFTQSGGGASTFSGIINLSNNKGVVWPGGSIRAEGNTLKLGGTTLIDLQQDTQIQGSLTTTGRLDVDSGVTGYPSTKIQTGGFGDSQSGINILNSTTGYGYVLFGDGSGADLYRGQIAYYHADDCLTFNTAGSQRMKIDSSGNVGITETNPLHKLSIKSTDDTRGILINNTLASSYAEAHFKANREYRIGTGGSTSAVEARNNFYIYDTTAGTHRVTLSAAGNFGIGTTTPNKKLVVKSPGADNGIFLLRNSTSGIIANIIETGSGDGALLLATNAASTSVLLRGSGNNYINSGNVGIGTTSPGDKLSVQGSIRTNSSGDGEVFFGTGSLNKIVLDGTDMEFWSGGLAASITMSNQGLIKFGVYGLGGTGTPTALLGVDNSGNVVKTTTAGDLPGGPYLPLAGGAMVGNLKLNDGVQAQFGTSSDFKVYHDGGSTYLENGTGNMYIMQRANNADMYFQCDNGSGGDANYLYLDGGIESIMVNKDMLLFNDGDGGKLKFGASQDLQIYHDGSNSYIQDVGSGDLRIDTSAFRLRSANGGESMMTAFEDGAVNLMHNNITRLSTTSAGAAVTGSLSTTQDISVSGDLAVTGTTTAGGTLICEGNITVQDSDKLQLGNSQDLELYHSSGASYIDNDTGHLYIRNNVDNDDGSNIYIQAKSGENSIICNDDSSVVLYNNNSAKFYTTTSGVGALGYIGFGSSGTSTGTSYGFRYGSSSPSGSQGIVISVSDTGGSYFDGVGRFQNNNTNQGAGMFQMVNYGSLYGRYMQFFRGSTSNIIGYIGYNGSNTSVTFSTTNSDIRTKKNITTWDENVLDKFKALQPKRFDFKAAIGTKGAVKERGFIAQYEKDKFPEAYQLNGTDEKATYGFHPMEMVPYMMKAIKDLTIKNEELERRIKTLES